MGGDQTTAPTRVAAKRLKQIATIELPAYVYTKASHCLVDTLGAASLGLDGPLAASMRLQRVAILADHSHTPSPLGVSHAQTDIDVRLISFSRAMRDDMHVGAVAHLGCIVIPAALTIAQRDSWTGEQLLRALVGGYEMGALLGTSLRASGKMIPHFRASGMVGAFAAAGAVACGQGSDEEVTANALSLAVNAACGINQWTCSGTPELFIHMGTAARAGIISHSLAKDGVRSSPEVLEGKHGLFNALGVAPEAMWTFEEWINSSDLGCGIIDVGWKPAGCCNYTQTTTALALRVSRMPGFSVADVESINITTTTAAIQYPGCDEHGPLSSVLQGKNFHSVWSQRRIASW